MIGSEIYVGCSNGMLLRFALQADTPNAVSSDISCSDCFGGNVTYSYFYQPESYRIISRQSLPEEKAVDELALAPSISRLLVLSSS